MLFSKIVKNGSKCVYKCICLIKKLFSNSRDAKESNISIFVNNNNPGENNADLCFPSQRVNSSSPTPAIKYLGVYFDCDLNFKFHLRFISGKTSRALHILRTCKNILSPKALKTLCYSLVHCHLIYGNQIWSYASTGIISELFRKQKAVIQVITNSRYNQHTEPLFKKLNFLPLPKLCEYFKLQFVQNLSKDSFHLLLIISGSLMKREDLKLSHWFCVTMMNFICLHPDCILLIISLYTRFQELGLIFIMRTLSLFVMS
jgi:hypothetical protein